MITGVRTVVEDGLDGAVFREVEGGDVLFDRVDDVVVTVAGGAGPPPGSDAGDRRPSDSPVQAEPVEALTGACTVTR